MKALKEMYLEVPLKEFVELVKEEPILVRSKQQDAIVLLSLEEYNMLQQAKYRGNVKELKTKP